MFTPDSPSLAQLIEAILGGMPPVGYGLLTSVLSQSETVLDSSPWSHGTQLCGHVNFVEEFLSSHSVCFTVQLEWE